MNWLDIVLAAICLSSIIAGLKAGFARIVVGLAATLLAFLSAAYFYDVAGAWAEPYVSAKPVANFVGFLLVLFGVLAAGAILGRLLAKLLKWVGLSWLDRLAGAAAGALRGALIGVVLLVGLVAFLPGDPPRPVAQSRIAPHLLPAASLLPAATREELRGRFDSTAAKLRKYWFEPLLQRLERHEL
jgi:membrane protein required for colicin V production